MPSKRRTEKAPAQGPEWVAETASRLREVDDAEFRNMGSKRWRVARERTEDFFRRQMLETGGEGTAHADAAVREGRERAMAIDIAAVAQDYARVVLAAKPLVHDAPSRWRMVEGRPVQVALPMSWGFVVWAGRWACGAGEGREQSAAGPGGQVGRGSNKRVH